MRGIRWTSARWIPIRKGAGCADRRFGARGMRRQRRGRSEGADGAGADRDRPFPYYYIQGTWLEPNPIKASEMQGVTLEADGSAVSVGMATLQFKNWSLADGKVMLTAESIGNGVNAETTDTRRWSNSMPTRSYWRRTARWCGVSGGKSKFLTGLGLIQRQDNRSVTDGLPCLFVGVWHIAGSRRIFRRRCEYLPGKVIFVSRYRSGHPDRTG